MICLELVVAEGARWPDFAPGAHAEFRLPDAKVRCCSLMGRSADGSGYRFGIKREEAGRSGSAWLHDVARLGTRLEISAPKGEFTLVEDAPATLFISGGIDITPLLPMMARLNEIGRPRELHYAVSQASEMVFRRRIEDLAERADW